MSSPADTAAKIQVLKSRPFVQKALQDPCAAAPEDILSCFFGVDYSDETNMKELMEGGHCMHSMPSLWFGKQTLEYDELCQYMSDAVHRAGRGELDRDPWFTTVNGRMAQMLLCDQVARNAFRGSKEAFAYDGTALDHARVLAAAYLGDDGTDLRGAFYPPYLAFVALPFMHSEEMCDHERSLEVLRSCRDRSPDHLRGWWDQEIKGGLDHKKVIERFGRYPHRNRAMGRESTPEEEDWLADTDALPNWAKSQLPSRN